MIFISKKFNESLSINKPKMNKAITLYICIILSLQSINGQEIGNASFYNKKFQGKRTYSGEKFNNKAFTGAHNSLPIGTLVRVTNLKNNKSVVVKINDRGHFNTRRVIDITYAAAKKIDIIRDGLVKVKVEVVIPDTIIQVSDSIKPILNTDSIKKIASKN